VFCVSRREIIFNLTDLGTLFVILDKNITGELKKMKRIFDK
jgi:hypothetical protein